MPPPASTALPEIVTIVPAGIDAAATGLAIVETGAVESADIMAGMSPL